MTLAEAATIIAAAVSILSIGIGIGKVLSGIAYLKREVKALRWEIVQIKERLTTVEKDQLEMKLILKQIAKKLRISY